MNKKEIKDKCEYYDKENDYCQDQDVPCPCDGDLNDCDWIK